MATDRQRAREMYRREAAHYFARRPPQLAELRRQATPLLRLRPGAASSTSGSARG